MNRFHDDFQKFFLVLDYSIIYLYLNEELEYSKKHQKIQSNDFTWYDKKERLMHYNRYRLIDERPTRER